MKFRGEYEFLSNFYPAPIPHGHLVFRTAEHFYQWCKTLDPQEKQEIYCASTPGKAKRLGAKCTIREDWEKPVGQSQVPFKVQTMRSILYAKFTYNPDLGEKLIATGDIPLVEENDWGDTFWGMCDGKGENELGKALMDLRSFLVMHIRG